MLEDAINYEIKIWEAARERDCEKFLEVVDENAVMVCGGFRCSGSEYAKVIKEFDLEKYEMTSFEIVYESETVRQIHYVIETFVSKPENADLAGKFHITSTWAKKDGGWKLVFNMDARIMHEEDGRAV